MGREEKDIGFILIIISLGILVERRHIRDPTD
jgi:hypothetical protein